MIETNNELIEAISRCPWFNRLGCGSGDFKSTIFLSSLQAWGGAENKVSPSTSKIADKMVWLPSTFDCEDPFYPDGFKSFKGYLETKDKVMEVYKATLQSLRSVLVSPLFLVGPHDFFTAAKGAAAYAFKGMAFEINLGLDRKWQIVAEHYFKGHWPCGFLKDGCLVVL